MNLHRLVIILSAAQNNNYIHSVRFSVDTYSDEKHWGRGHIWDGMQSYWQIFAFFHD